MEALAFRTSPVLSRAAASICAISLLHGPLYSGIIGMDECRSQTLLVVLSLSGRVVQLL